MKREKEIKNEYHSTYLSERVFAFLGDKLKLTSHVTIWLNGKWKLILQKNEESTRINQHKFDPEINITISSKNYNKYSDKIIQHCKDFL